MGANNNYQIVYAPSVYDDLDEIFAYISTELQNPEAALRLIETIEASIQKLSVFPYIHPVT